MAFSSSHLPEEERSHQALFQKVGKKGLVLRLDSACHGIDHLMNPAALIAKFGFERIFMFQAPQQLQS